MQEDVHYLYKITNLVNGKLYIGVTNNPTQRKYQHFSNSKEGRLVNKAARKYGKDSFSFEVICVGSREYVYDLEQKAIELYNSDATKGHGYNLSVGGEGGRGGVRGPIESRADDKEVFASGWWFPNKRTCLKALNWGTGKFTSRKKAGTLGDVKLPEKVRSDDTPMYVSGFWFPHRRCCLEKLNIHAVTFHKWKRQGTLGDLVHHRMGAVYDAPQYVGGFWFSTLRLASELLQKDPEVLYCNISLGLVEQNTYEKNTTARVGKWKISVNKVTYESIVEASKETGISRSKISNNLNENKQGFAYEYSYEISKRPYK